MKVKIVANNDPIDKEYYDKFIGQEVSGKRSYHEYYELNVQDINGSPTSLWHEDEVEVIEE
jgi:hypothetical protein